MSIDDLKKKSKLSLDEMHDTKDVGKLEIQKSDQQISKSNERKDENKKLKIDYRSKKQEDKQFTKKMTFWMTEEIYDVFNEIYHKRMLAKKKVDKASLICEAIQLLNENEEG